MVDKNILMKNYNGTDWDNLFPISKAKNIITDLYGGINLEDWLRVKPIGSNALGFIDSAYLPNDCNLFGYRSDGVSFSNLITMEQNNIVKVGDYDALLWLVSNSYVSLRSPSNPSYQQIDAEGNPIGPGRTILHQGNTGGHLVVFSDGDHVLSQNIYSELHTLTVVNGQYPANSYNNFYYTIPRAGMYLFNVILKVKNAPTSVGAIRFGVEIIKASDQSTNQSDMQDVFYDPSAYGTPFISSTFMYRLSTGDQVKPIVKPLKEDVTITNGTKFYLYQLGDTIQA